MLGAARSAELPGAAASDTEACISPATAIAIRTAVIKDDILHIQAGGGVVADSVPKLEYKESMNKARAMFRAAAMVRSGSGEEH